MRMRSKLFVPAIRHELFEKALRSGADAICLRSRRRGFP